MYFVRKASLGAILVATVVCYIHLGIQQAATYPQSGMVQRYFQTPEQSVEIIAKLARAQDWETLESFQFVPMGHDALSALFNAPVDYKEAVMPPGGDIDVVVAARTEDGELSPEAAGSYRLRAFPEGYQLVPKGAFILPLEIQAVSRPLPEVPPGSDATAGETD